MPFHNFHVNNLDVPNSWKPAHQQRTPACNLQIDESKRCQTWTGPQSVERSLQQIKKPNICFETQWTEEVEEDVECGTKEETWRDHT